MSNPDHFQLLKLLADDVDCISSFDSTPRPLFAFNGGCCFSALHPAMSGLQYHVRCGSVEADNWKEEESDEGSVPMLEQVSCLGLALQKK